MSPVWEFSQSQALTCHQWPLRDVPSGFDVGVVVSFGHLLPRWLIQSFPLGILNVHPSLLPRWRGGAPIHHTILNGDTVTGVSIMRILPDKFDVGPILLQRECIVPDGSTTSSLSKVLATLGSNMLIEVLSDLITFIDGETPQVETGLTLALRVPSRMAWVDWNSSRKTIDRVFRALSEQMPLKTMFDGDEIRLEKMLPLTEDLDVSRTDVMNAGSILFDKRSNVICVRCKDGWVGFKAVSPVGRKWMTAKEFHSGYLAMPRCMRADEPKRFMNCDLIKR